MKKAIVIGALALLLLSSFIVLGSGGARAASTEWTQKNIVLLWDKSYDNKSTGYPDGIAYVKDYMLRTGAISKIEYDYELTTSELNDSFYIIPDMHRYATNVYNNITAKVPNFFTKAHYAILAYYWSSTYGDETWDGWVKHPPTETKTATIVYAGKVIRLDGTYNYDYTFVRSVAVVDGVEKIITDTSGQAVFYKYHDDYFGLVPLNNYLGIDIEISALLKELGSARTAVPFTVVIDDVRDKVGWTAYHDNYAVNLTYNNLINISKTLKKYGVSATLAVETNVTATHGAIVRAVKDADNLFVTYHQNAESEDYGGNRDYNTLNSQYNAGMQNWSRLNFPESKQLMKIWVLPQGHYNENTSQLASEHNIQYFIIDGFGLNWDTYEYWNTATMHVNKNGNNLPYEADNRYNIKIVDRTYVTVFSNSINPPTTEQEAIQYVEDQGWGQLSFEDIERLEFRNQLSMYRGDIYFHAGTFTNGEISQKYLDALLSFEKDAQAPYVGVNGYEHSLNAEALDTSTINYAYTAHKVKITITNPGDKDFPYYFAIPKSQIGSLSSGQHYAVESTRASSASVIKEDSNYVYVKATVSAGSIESFVVYIMNNTENSTAGAGTQSLTIWQQVNDFFISHMLEIGLVVLLAVAVVIVARRR